MYLRKAPPAVVRSIVESQAAKILQEELHYKIIAEWEHYALLTLVDTRGFKAEKSWIAKRLKISDLRAQTVLEQLVQSGLLSIDALGRASLHQVKVNTTREEKASTALRQSHREALHMGLEKLENIAIEQRDFSSMTIAVSMERLPEAKNMIRRFQKQLSEFLEDGKRTEVYQICMQLYPLTDPNASDGGPQ